MKKNSKQEEEEISLTELIARFRNILGYLLKKWVIIFSIAIMGAAIGFTYAWFHPIKYISRVSFVLEDSKSTGGGGLAALAGQFGFDIGGSGGGIFSSDNILLFLKSESLCRETLLSGYDSAGTQTLADKYAEASKLKADWRKKKKIGEIIFSKYRNSQFPRLEDSLMQVITNKILMKDLEVGKPDKKSSFIEVKATMPDELLSKYFVERLVKIATDHYVESKTKIKALNVAKLQSRADSLGRLLNNRTYSAASTQQNLVDINPALRIASVDAEITTRDKTMIATIFAEVVKNLELAKVALNQETPTIQIVDQSSLPLKKDKVSKTVSIIVGGIVAALICIVFLLVRRWWQVQITSQKEIS